MNESQIRAIFAEIAGQTRLSSASQIAAEDDTDWFAANPRQQLRLRPLVPDEFGEGETQSQERDAKHMVLVIDEEIRLLVRIVAMSIRPEDTEDAS